MPRVKPLIRPDPEEIKLLKEIGGIMAALEISQKELARRAGISPSTLSNRMHNIGDIRLSEILAIRRAAKREGIEL